MLKQERSIARQRGFTLAEVLVATAVFAVIFIATLLIYDRSNKVFSSGTQASDLQQNTRVGYEKLVSDLRLAGFDYKRAGVPTNAVPQWLPSTPYGLGVVVVPTNANGFSYRCTTAGTSNATPPTWNTGAGSTTNDNDVVWTQFGVTGVAFDQPDEQIEYAWHSAITIRANYNYDGDDDTNHYEHGRERNLESTAFPVVTTGNSEIVTYALVSDKAGASNSDSVTFYADVNSSGAPTRRAYPGGQAERLVTISGVDLSNNNPPYHLNRYTLDDAGQVVTTPLANNIRSLTFSYFQDQAARQPLTNVPAVGATPVAVTDVGGGDQYDPSTPNALLTNRIIRGKIRAVTVTLVGMNAIEDKNYQDTDTADTIAPTYRKFTLQSTIVPRNLGITGLRQITANPPPAPTLASVCYGYCGVAVVSWNPGPGGVDAVYDVLYSTSATGPFTNVLPAGTATTYAVDLTQPPNDMTQHYYFEVMAKNSGGSTVSTNIIDVDVKNATKPSPVSSVTATGSTSGAAKISLRWTSPTSNASGAPACNPIAATALYPTVGAELKGYRIYRATSSAGFAITDAGVVRVLDENGLNSSGVAVTPTPVSNGAGGWFWDDTSILYCTDYFYKIVAVEWCAAAGNLNTTTDPTTGLSAVATPSPNTAVHATTGTVPMAPTGLTVDGTTTCNFGTNKCYPVTLTWQKVTKDTTNTNIIIDKYNIYRLQRKNGAAYPSGATATLAGTLTGQSALPSPITWSEPVSSNLAEHDPSDNIAFTYDYYVTAVSCVEGGQSNTVTVPVNCSIGGTFTAAGSAGGNGSAATPYIGPTSVTFTPAVGQTPSAVYVSVDGATATAVSGTPYTRAWSDPADGQTHSFQWIVTVGTCTQHFAIYIVDDPPACSLTTGSGIVTTNGNLQLDIRLTNSLAQPLQIQSIDISWNDPGDVNNKLNWESLQFPSGGNLPATFTAPTTKADPRTVTFTTNPLPGTLISSDATVPASSSLTLSMIFSKNKGNPSARTAGVTSMTVHYKRPDTGTSVLDCQILP
jgi:prepilin-type N-terminal cleavage/methylation domain-containing protein